jgi:uridine kinase
MIIIGIAGPSSSGKSSIAKLLAKQLDATILCLDEFYKKGYPDIYINHEGQSIRTFERPEMYDGERMAQVIIELEEKGEVFFQGIPQGKKEYELFHIIKKDFLIVEGFLIYLYPSLLKLINHKYFIDIDEDEIMKRRLARGSLSSDEFFVKIGMKEWVLFGEQQKHVDGVIVLDGKKSYQELLVDIKREIHFL